MTIIEAIDYIDAIKPNTFTKTEKTKWLSNLEGIIYEEIVRTHEGAENVIFSGYNDETPDDTILIIPAPYDEVYTKYLEAQIDYFNGETRRFNNTVLVYNAAYTNARNWYNKTHIPLSKPFKVF